MRAIIWLFRIAVFVLFLAFAIENTEPVVINLFLGYYLEAPLVLFLLGVLLIGVLLGMLMLVPNLLRKRRELAKLRREVQQHAPLNPLPAESEAHATPTL